VKQNVQKTVTCKAKSVHAADGVLVYPRPPPVSVGHACRVRPGARNQTSGDCRAAEIEFRATVGRWTSSFGRFVGRRRGRGVNQF